MYIYIYVYVYTFFYHTHINLPSASQTTPKPPRPSSRTCGMSGFWTRQLYISGWVLRLQKENTFHGSDYFGYMQMKARNEADGFYSLKQITNGGAS